MNEQADWYRITKVDQIDTPALLIYPERAVSNIDKAITIAKGPAMLRPHVKTNKSATVCRLMIGRGITKFKCATIAEAEMLGQCGAKDVLLAYQPTVEKMQRLMQLMVTYPNTAYSCLVDNIATAQMIAYEAISNNLVIPVYIDLNVGMDRTGIAADKALPLFNAIGKFPNIEFAGLHAYDGHIEEVDLNERTAHCERAFAPVEQLRKDIQALGHPFPLLVAGGSPTFPLHVQRSNTECSPGTFVFWDKNYSDHIPDLDLDLAALVLTRVISLPATDKICLDLGYKSIACEKPLVTRAYFLNAPQLVPHSQSEEHLVIKVPEEHNFKVGDVLYALPMHICPTVAMYNQAHIITNGVYTKKWAIDARDRVISI